MFRTHNCILIQLHHPFYATFYNPRRGQILSCGKLRNQMPGGTRPETFAQPIALQVDIMTFKYTITFLNNCRQHKQNSVIHCSATQNHCHKIPSMIKIFIRLEGPEDPHRRNSRFLRSRDHAHASIPLAQTPWGLIGRAWLQAGAQRVVIVVSHH